LKKVYEFFLFALLILPAVGLAAPLTFSGKVVKVIDGDTVDVLRDGRPLRVRLFGIDAPEKGQPFGQAAKRYATELTALKVVEVRGETLDRYGRTVGELLLPGGQSVNRRLVEAGYAWHYAKYSNDPVLARLEQEARAARRGLWQDKAPEPPWDYRRRKVTGGTSHPPDLLEQLFKYLVK
jgi:endonuclease YncB( thermonuclease family)